MKRARRGLQHGSMLAAAALSLSLVATSAYATDLCHNIGGPRDLGANCDGTGTCTYQLEGGGAITVPEGSFLGIRIGGPQFNVPPPIDQTNPAVIAHFAHGDGIASAEFDPPLHLASAIGPHRASNVDCLAERKFPQPPEPGN
jgi:hypothetical protein